jgi:hypothetical protein
VAGRTRRIKRHGVGEVVRVGAEGHKTSSRVETILLPTTSRFCYLLEILSSANTQHHPIVKTRDVVLEIQGARLNRCEPLGLLRSGKWEPVNAPTLPLPPGIMHTGSPNDHNLYHCDPTA